MEPNESAQLTYRLVLHAPRCGELAMANTLWELALKRGQAKEREQEGRQEQQEQGRLHPRTGWSPLRH
jgi:hypothetical protein